MKREEEKSLFCLPTLCGVILKHLAQEEEEEQTFGSLNFNSSPGLAGVCREGADLAARRKGTGETNVI